MRARDSLLSAVLGLMASTCLLASALAQSQPAADTQGGDKSWNSTTEVEDSTGVANRSKIISSHKEAGNKTVDQQTVERLGSGGRYQPYLDTEKETVRVDANTVRTVERSYARDPDGQKKLVQVTEEQTRTSANGEQKMVRTTSNPDVNGSLQIVRREIEDTKQTSPTVQDKKTTVLSPNTSGELIPIEQVQERQTRTGDHVVQFRKSTQAADINGAWQTSEVREGNITENGKDRVKEETVSRPGSDGKLVVGERTITKESENAAGEQRHSQETFSDTIPGTVGDGSLQLTQRVTTVRRAGADGRQVTEQRVEQRNPGAPGDSPRVTQRTIDIVRPNSGGATETHTIETLNSSGSLGVIWVDTARTNGTPAIKVDTKVGDKAAPAKTADEPKKP
jgi:hypothetical protein